MMTANWGISRRRGMRFGAMALLLRRTLLRAAALRCLTVAEAAEDHLPRARLPRVRHGELDFLVQVRSARFDYDHRAVVEVADALPRLFAGLEQAHDHLLAWQRLGLEGVGRSE